ncbi:hypothetical protein NVP1084O_171 [Vibrio phage 1.084.O._10N.261.49.F5]|nr:hypothetical protein NVP1084O_171 [Vibrio phage 1.084.O._10N.261.49.F5]
MLSDVTPRPYSKGIQEVFYQYMRAASRDIKTGMPVTVKSVDYDRCLVTVQPNIRTILGMTGSDAEYQIEQLPVEEVPILFEDADNGTARITVPIQEGDTGVLVYAHRNTSVFLESDGKTIQDTEAYEGAGFNGATPKLGFRAGMKTKSEARPFSKDKVIVEYNSASTSISRQGEIKSTNGTATSVINPDGSVNINNGGGFIEISTDGTVNINGFTITPDGTATSPTSVIAPTMTAGQSLTVAGKEMSEHKHSNGTAPDGNTGTPI